MTKTSSNALLPGSRIRRKLSFSSAKSVSPQICNSPRLKTVASWRSVLQMPRARKWRQPAHHRPRCRPCPRCRHSASQRHIGSRRSGGGEHARTPGGAAKSRALTPVPATTDMKAGRASRARRVGQIAGYGRPVGTRVGRHVDIRGVGHKGSLPVVGSRAIVTTVPAPAGRAAVAVKVPLAVVRRKI